MVGNPKGGCWEPAQVALFPGLSEGKFDRGHLLASKVQTGLGLVTAGNGLLQAAACSKQDSWQRTTVFSLWGLMYGSMTFRMRVSRLNLSKLRGV